VVHEHEHIFIQLGELCAQRDGVCAGAPSGPKSRTFPQAPSPTITSFLRISDMVVRVVFEGVVGGQEMRASGAAEEEHRRQPVGWGSLSCEAREPGPR
jgi:hypothetical protein